MTDEELIRFTLHGIKIVPSIDAAQVGRRRRARTVCAIIKRAQAKRRAA